MTDQILTAIARAAYAAIELRKKNPTYLVARDRGTAEIRFTGWYTAEVQQIIAELWADPELIVQFAHERVRRRTAAKMPIPTYTELDPESRDNLTIIKLYVELFRALDPVAAVPAQPAASDPASSGRVFPLTVSLGGETITLRADGTVCGHRDKFMEMLARTEGAVSTSDEAVQWIATVSLLHFPWADPRAKGSAPVVEPQVGPGPGAGGGPGSVF